MAETILKLKKPVTQITIDMSENSLENEICANCAHAKLQFLSRDITQLICEEDSEWREVEPDQTCKIGCFKQK